MAITGGPGDGDRPATAAAMRRLCVDLACRLSLGLLFALMARAALSMGLDTGPMHVAAAFGAPVVVLLPQARHRDHYARWYPFGSDHIPIRGDVNCPECHRGYCPPRFADERPACMERLSVSDVIGAAAAPLNGDEHPGRVLWRGDAPPSCPAAQGAPLPFRTLP